MQNPEQANTLITMLQEDQQQLRLFRQGKVTKEEIVFGTAERCKKLEEILDTGFPNKEMVGDAGYQAAVVLALHSGLELLREFLKMHEKQSANSVDIQDRAFLTDKILVGEGKPQRYGTQYQGIENGKVVFLTMESADAVDERRKSLSLPSLSEYEDFILSSARQ